MLIVLLTASRCMGRRSMQMSMGSQLPASLLVYTRSWDLPGCCDSAWVHALATLQDGEGVLLGRQKDSQPELWLRTFFQSGPPKQLCLWLQRPAP